MNTLDYWETEWGRLTDTFSIISTPAVKRLSDTVQIDNTYKEYLVGLSPITSLSFQLQLIEEGDPRKNVFTSDVSKKERIDFYYDRSIISKLDFEKNEDWQMQIAAYGATIYIRFNDYEMGKKVFVEIAELSGNHMRTSCVEWDYFLISDGTRTFGELSTSGISNKMCHGKNFHKSPFIKEWNHFHPNNTSESWYPSYSDQDLARALKCPCYLYNHGTVREFYSVLPKSGYISMDKYRELQNL